MGTMDLRNKKTGAVIVAALTLFTLTSYGLYRQASPKPARATSAHKVVAAAAEPEVEEVLATSGDVSLSAKLDRGTLLSGSDGTVHVALTLRAAERETALPARRPTDALVVLDISGSMSGQKLDYAKQALHQLIDRLSPDDRFALVTYESEANLLLPLTKADGHAIARFHRAVNELDTAGGTNMSGGLDVALDALRKQERSGRSRRVLLLSDGHANEGDSSQAGLAARVRAFTRIDDVVSTMGIGDDFNEDLMTGLAETGTGNFYYLSRVEMLGGYFDAELRAAGQTVASALELTFAPAAGVELLELGGYPIDQKGGQLVVRPGNLIAGQERVLWATVRAPTDALRDVALGSFSLRYKKGEAAFALNALPLPALACVADAARFEGSIVQPVWEEYVATEQYQKAQSKLGWAIGSGDAQDIQREQQAYETNRVLAEKLGSARVLTKLSEMASAAHSAISEQSAPNRAYHAKQKKSRALFERRRDAYNSDPLLGL